MRTEPLKIKNNVDATRLSEAVKEYTVPARKDEDGVRAPISIVALVDPTKDPVPFISLAQPWRNGVVKWTRDALLNDSDKSFTVPRGKIWDLKGVEIEYTATAVVGNRRITVALNDGTNNIATTELTGNVAASQVLRASFWSGLPRSTSGLCRLSNLGLQGDVNLATALVSFPLLLAGYIVRVLDVNAVDAAADDMVVIVHYVEYDA